MLRVVGANPTRDTSFTLEVVDTQWGIDSDHWLKTMIRVMVIN